ncbi:helicase [Fictibacillus macauensis ZFHKF-1]|uniref:Helicase n=1 Tax=Fictibacillus macauensis ZFHKF-1 TaxID=1196324 RepID=I8AJL0_9BACL|nr:DEAD/DEAH box helicase [Fictibacillus macauensis]EIT85714.1 helicase [Fictibacillus macauensis ZFHKF-1]
MIAEKNLIVNSDKENLLAELDKSLNECVSFYFSVAFVNFSGIQLLLDSLKAAEERGVKGKIITSTYLNFTDAKALERLAAFRNIELKVFITDKEMGFHTKAYIFEYDDYFKIIIGSSNITQSALKSNVEWNVQVIAKEEAQFVRKVMYEYQNLWAHATTATTAFIRHYEDFLKSLKRDRPAVYAIYENNEYILPNRMQREAIENLTRLRNYGAKRALVIAATGTGKTYMAAFHVKNDRPRRLLFVVHREEIVRKAKETFQKLLPNTHYTFGLLTGTSKEVEADYIFATVQTLSQWMHHFQPDHFDYIVLDEAHHATSPSYQKVLDYFTPAFMLGMTATPERCDHGNVFEVFDHNIALEVRLHDALAEDLIIPFHYFGITDVDTIDLSTIEIDNIAEITKRLKVNERVDFIIEKMRFYGHDGDKRKCLGFCASIEHALYMAEQFNARGLPSLCLSGGHSVKERNEAIVRLENEEDPLQFIFTVDIFNEGVDIPSVNLVLMLRPTNSPVVFIQQLGRGLRRHETKTFLTVLDFIGNHNKAFLVAMALNGNRYYDKKSLKVAIVTKFANVPGCTHIVMDRIAQERILEQIDAENFHSMKYLREAYTEFKKLNGGHTPYYLVDYLKYDGAPDPLSFVSREKSYLHFVAKVEKEEQLKRYLSDVRLEGALKELSSMLPIKRIHEFVIAHYLLSHEQISLQVAQQEIEKYVKHSDHDTIVHAMECLNQNYYDSGQKKVKPKLFSLQSGVLRKTPLFKELVENPIYSTYIEDIIQYGMFRYEKIFKEKPYGIPHLKRYEQYQMADAALLSNYRKTHSSFRGSGLLTNGKEYFLYIDLHKEEHVKESLQYKDTFLDERHFQWQSVNNTTQQSERGQNIIHNEARGVHLHLFIRKYSKLDGKTEPFIYIGKGNTIAYEGEKPITVTLELEYEVPTSLYNEFILPV